MGAVQRSAVFLNRKNGAFPPSRPAASSRVSRADPGKSLIRLYFGPGEPSRFHFSGIYNAEFNPATLALALTETRLTLNSQAAMSSRSSPPTLAIRTLSHSLTYTDRLALVRKQTKEQTRTARDVARDNSSMMAALPRSSPASKKGPRRGNLNRDDKQMVQSGCKRQAARQTGRAGRAIGGGLTWFPRHFWCS